MFLTNTDALTYALVVRNRLDGPIEWTPEECLAFDGLLDGCENVAAYWDTIHREALQACDVCEDVYHQAELKPCGPAEWACPNCCEAWDQMMPEDSDTRKETPGASA